MLSAESEEELWAELLASVLGAALLIGVASEAVPSVEPLACEPEALIVRSFDAPDPLCSPSTRCVGSELGPFGAAGL